MTILGTASANPGFVGIGVTAPAYQLDVQNNINVNTANAFGRGYWIDGFCILQVPGVENTFVGKGAGVNTVLIPNAENTFVGFQAGGLNINGVRNTFVGRAAGYAITSGDFNTFVGADAALILTIGNANTFVGEHSGFQILNGDNNTFMGSHAGQGLGSSLSVNNTFIGMNCGEFIDGGTENTFTGMSAGRFTRDGLHNSFYGTWAGLQNVNGNGNVAMGYQAHRFNHSGNNNTFVGTDAGTPSMSIFWAITNASGFGWDAVARADNTMILGNNLVNVGIGLSNDNVQNGPQNKLEIDAGLNGFNPSLPATVGASGLTFRDLHSGNTPSPANGVALSVNNNGEVILVPAGGGFPFGGVCGNTNTMTSDFEIPMGTFNYVFSGQGANVTNVGIGMSAVGCTPTAKLEVHQNSANPSSVAVSVNNGDQDGLGIVLNVNGGGTNHAGVLSTVQGSSNTNTGFISNAFGGTQTNGGIYKATGGSALNIGVRSEANGGTQNIAFFDEMLAIGGTLNVGIASRVEGAATNYGGRFNASGATGVNYGIRASATGSGPGPNYAGWFDGDIGGTGAFLYTSDQNLKQNIDSISNALSIVSLLLPKTFFFDTVSNPNMGFSSRKQWGFIAQDVETVLPELVDEATLPAEYDSLGNIISPALNFKTLNYNAFIAILMKAVQEQQQRIDSMQSTIADMQSQINGCCSSNLRTQDPNINQTDVTLTNSESIVLNQNVPNPFAEQTTITYNLPSTVQKAQILFYDANGKLIKAIDLDSRGKGQVNVFANDLSSGIYSYALIADGQIADTKRMAKTQ